MIVYHGPLILNHVAKKVSSAIGGLRQIRQFVNDDTLITIYNSLIQPSFDYNNCDLVWDNLSKGLATRLQKLQNRAGRVILRAAYDVSSEDILKELGWSDLKTRRAKHKATQMFKISTGEAPNYLTDRFFKVEARNPYNIRNSELNINLPLPKTDFMKRSFLYTGPKLSNSLPNSIKSAKTLAAFKRGLEDNNILDFDMLSCY